MSRLTSELLVKLTDQVSGPAGKMSGALKKATADLGKVDIFKGQAKRLDELADAHQRAREKVRGLAQQLMSADSPSKSLQASYVRATAAVDSLGSKLDWQRARVRGAAHDMSAMGVAVNNLAAGELRLRANVERATAAMMRQEAAALRSATRRQAIGTAAAGVGIVAAHKGLQIGKDAIGGAGRIDYALRDQQFATSLSREVQDRVLYPQAKRIGQDTKFSNEDVVRAQTTFANGLPAAMKQAGVIKSVIDQVKNYALTVKGVDMDQAAMAVKGYLLSLGKDISTPEKAELEARGASNKLIRATKIGGLSHDDLMPFIARGASAGRIAGLSDETMLAMAVGLKRSNISGDQAGTALRTLASKLVAPTAKGQGALAAAGIDYNDYTTMPGGLSVGSFEKKFKQDFGKPLTDSVREQLAEAFADPEIVGSRGAFTAAVTEAVSSLFGAKKDGSMRAKDAQAVAKKAGDFHKFSVEGVDAERLLLDIISKDPSLGVLNAFMTDKHGNKFALLAKAFEQFQKDRADLKSVPGDYGDKASELIQGGLGGALERLTGSIETFKTTLGKENESWLTPLTDAIGSSIDRLSGLVEKSPILAAGAGALATAGSGIGGTFKFINDMLGGNGPAIALTGSAAALTKSAFALDAAAAALSVGKGAGAVGTAAAAAGAGAGGGKLASMALFAGTRLLPAAALGYGMYDLFERGYEPATASGQSTAKPGEAHNEGLKRRQGVNEQWRQRHEAFKRLHDSAGAPDAARPASFLAAPALDLSAFSAAEEKAKATGETMQSSLDVTATPKIDTSQLDGALAKTRALKSELDGLGASAAVAASRSTGIVGRTMRGIHADGD